MNDYIIPGYVPNGTADEFAWMDGFLKPEPWMRDGLCRQTDPDLFFGDGDKPHMSEKRTADAKKVCLSCPVLAQCQEYAIRTGQTYGTWGALSQKELRKIHANKEQTA